MANRKNLKKDINRLVNELVSDCLQYMKSHPGKSEEKIAEIISETLKLRKDLITGLNTLSEISDKKEIKKQCIDIVFKLIGSIDNSYKTLSKLAR